MKIKAVKIQHLLNISLALSLVSLAFLIFALTGCSAAPGGDDKAEKSGSDGKITVVTTLFPYYDFVRQIAGDSVDLKLVLPAGMDSHSFEPSPADIMTIQSADILICNGGEMERWLRQVLSAVDTSDMEILTMMDYVDTVEEQLVEGMEDAEGPGGHDHGEHSHEGRRGEDDNDDGHEVEIEYDEHIWTSPVNSMKLAAAIGKALQDRDPIRGDVYEGGVKSYTKRLERLDEEFRAVMSERKRNLIVVSDKFPFRYLAEEYGLQYRAAFPACGSDTEPSAQTIAYLIDKIREDGIPTVYYLELSSHRVADLIEEETGAKPLLLHSCHNVTRQEFDSGVTYVELMENNVENLRKGLVE